VVFLQSTEFYINEVSAHPTATHKSRCTEGIPHLPSKGCILKSSPGSSDHPGHTPSTQSWETTLGAVSRSRPHLVCILLAFLSSQWRLGGTHHGQHTSAPFDSTRIMAPGKRGLRTLFNRHTRLFFQALAQTKIAVLGNREGT
jgi:hypothetical protein